MSGDRGSQTPVLKLVAGGERIDISTSPPNRDLDWAILMARAQDGDGAAYRRLLQEITPYLRSLAARRHRSADDIEDAVQDILLTFIPSATPTIRCDPSVRGWRRLPSGARSIGCGGEAATSAGRRLSSRSTRQSRTVVWIWKGNRTGESWNGPSAISRQHNRWPLNY